jgi:type IV secretory pathway TrbF-like protein
MSFFKKKNKKEEPTAPSGKGEGNRNTSGVKKPPENVPMALDERMRREIAENNPWMRSKKRHIDVYQELAFSVAQWRLATFTLLVVLALSVLCNFSLAKGVKVQPYVVEVDEHGYAVPVKGFDPADVDARVVSAQIGAFIINSRARFSDIATQLIFSENSYKAVADGSPAAKMLNDYYVAAPPTGAQNQVGVRILSVSPLSNSSYQASWVETVYVSEGKNEEFGYIGTFSVAVSPPSEFVQLVDNPLGIYVTDYNIIRSY